MKVWVVAMLLSITPLRAADRPLTFAQITDAHLFDSGKIRDKNNPNAGKNSAVEIADTRMAWHWSILEINREVQSDQKVDFVVFTGDFGLEKVSTEPLSNCLQVQTAVEEVAQAFISLLVPTIYVVRGNNDLDNEDVADLDRFDDFVSRLEKRLQSVNKRLVNLTPVSAGDASFEKGFKIVGLDSSFFKKGGTATHQCEYKAATPSNLTQSRDDRQLQELTRVRKLVSDDKATIIFTHIPDLDDPYLVAEASAKQTPGAVTSWAISQASRTEWNTIVKSDNVLAVFAGHFHDPRRFIYLPLYRWQQNINLEVSRKTYVAPPLAAKFQEEASPQARGFLLGTISSTGKVRAEIHWLNTAIVQDFIAEPIKRSEQQGYDVPYLDLLLGGLLLVVSVLLIVLPKADKGSSYNDLKAAGFVLLFIVLGFSVIAFASKRLQATESPVLITLLVVPLLLYGIISGRLSEFSGPGGWGAKFRETANESVDASVAPVDLTHAEMEAIPKTSLADLQARIGNIRQDRPLVMTLTLGKANYYQKPVVGTAIERLLQFRNFRFVMVLQKDGRLVGYFLPQGLVFAMKSIYPEAENLVNAINQGDDMAVKSYPGVITDKVFRQTTNAQALDKMEGLDLNAMVVVDDQEKPIGVIERESILSRMVLALAKGAKA